MNLVSYQSDEFEFFLQHPVQWIHRFNGYITVYDLKESKSSFSHFVAERNFFGGGIELFIWNNLGVSAVDRNTQESSVEGIKIKFMGRCQGPGLSIV